MCQQAKTNSIESNEVLYQRVLLKQRQLSEVLLDHDNGYQIVAGVLPL